jgi:hypothetical protein
MPSGLALDDANQRAVLVNEDIASFVRGGLDQGHGLDFLGVIDLEQVAEDFKPSPTQGREGQFIGVMVNGWR